jgi:hypothetical protein
VSANGDLTDIFMLSDAQYERGHDKDLDLRISDLQLTKHGSEGDNSRFRANTQSWRRCDRFSRK